MLEAPASYDLVLVHPSTETTTQVETFLLIGLTTRSPVLEVGMIEAPRAAGNVGVDVVAGDAGGAPDGYQLAFVPSDDHVEAMAAAFAPSSSSGLLEGTLRWYGEPTQHGSLYVLGTRQTGAFPTAFSAAGVADYGLEAGQPATLRVDVAPITSARLAGAIAPGPTTLGSFTYVLQPDGVHSFLRWTSVADLSTTIDLPMPNSPGYRATVQAGFSYGEGGARANVWRANLAPNTTDIVLSAPPGIAAEIPPAGASALDLATTTFGWRSQAGGTNVLDIRCPPPSVSVPVPAYRVVVVTPHPDAALAETSSLGSPLPSGTSRIWSVGALPGVLDTDTFLRLGGRRLTRVVDSRSDGVFVFTENRTLSTQ